MKSNNMVAIAALAMAAADASAMTQCQVCEPGTWSDGGTSEECQACPAGNSCMSGYKFACTGKEYQDKTGQPSCKTCGHNAVGASGGGNTCCPNPAESGNDNWTCVGNGNQLPSSAGARQASGGYCHCRVKSCGAVSQWVPAGQYNALLGCSNSKDSTTPSNPYDNICFAPKATAAQVCATGYNYIGGKTAAACPALCANYASEWVTRVTW
jgi:hypothetical protein